MPGRSGFPNVRGHMRTVTLPALIATSLLIGAVACSMKEVPTGSTSLAPAGAAKSSGVPYTAQLPDLIVDSKATQNNWLNRDEDLPANLCSVQEGGVSPGMHSILRFTVTTPNIGKGDVFVGSLRHYRGDRSSLSLASFGPLARLLFCSRSR